MTLISSGSSIVSSTPAHWLSSRPVEPARSARVVAMARDQFCADAELGQDLVMGRTAIAQGR
jgi:hypothetical protein